GLSDPSVHARPTRRTDKGDAGHCQGDTPPSKGRALPLCHRPPLESPDVPDAAPLTPATTSGLVPPLDQNFGRLVLDHSVRTFVNPSRSPREPPMGTCHARLVS